MLHALSKQLWPLDAIRMLNGGAALQEQHQKGVTIPYDTRAFSFLAGDCVLIAVLKYY